MFAHEKRVPSMVLKHLYEAGKACMTIALLACNGQTLGQQHVEFNFQNDNDLYLFNRQDQYYTNGIFFNLRRTADSTSLAPREVNRLWRITVGQKLYNAYTAQIYYIEEVDRPITAYLFLSGAVDRYFSDESFMSFSAEVGTIGRRALGRQLQESVHRVLSLYEIAGWEYQLNNAFGIDASARYGRLLYRIPARWLDLSAQGEARLGLNHTGASVSAALRLGRINPLHRSAFTSSRLQATGDAPSKEFFFYYAPQLKVVGYDATLQGGMFLRNKGPVTHTPARWVWYHQFGVMHAKNALTVRMQYTFYSKEVPGMFFRHRYGSIGASYRF